MSDPNRFQLNVDTLVVGSGTTGKEVDIISYNGADIKINGVVPSGGGGSQLPINGTGDIDIIGNLNVNDVQGGGAKGIISASKSMSTGLGGLYSSGNIETAPSGIIKSGSSIYFDGQDIYKKYPNVVPAIPDKTYKEYKGLVATGDNSTFTGTNVFRETVKVQTSDGAVPPVLTDQITLNKNGDLQSKNANVDTLIQTGKINCGNGADNEVRARKFYTRTNENSIGGKEGWSISQQIPSNPADPVDTFLQIKAGEAGGLCTIISSDFAGSEPSITLDPRNQATGGKIVSTALNLGVNGASDFVIEKPKSGAETNNLLVKVGSTNGTIKFQNQSGTNLMLIEEASSSNKGRLYIGEGVFFGTTGIHNNITESGNNLLIDQNNANSETQIRDNSNNPIVSFRKTAVVVSNPLPIQFGAYSFRPIQYRLTRTLTIAATPDTTNFTNMAFNCQSDTWTTVNDNTSVSMYNLALEGYYKCTITQTADSSSGNFSACDLMFDYILHLSIQTAPDIDITEPSFNYRKKPSNQARPTIEIDHLNTPVQSQPVFVLYPNQSAGETMPIEVRLTKLDF
jgi:hypothetical protein